MTVTAFVYANALKHLCSRDKNIDWANNTIKMMLTTSSYAPSQYSHSVKSDVTNEVTGVGYTAGGTTLGTKTNVVTNNILRLSSAPATWPTSTITARKAVCYDDSGSGDANKALFFWVDFGADVSSTTASFTITPDPTDGWVKWTATDYGS